MGWLKERFKDLGNPVKETVKSIADIPGSIARFAENPLTSIGTGVGKLYAAPGRALGSDLVTDWGNKLGAAQAGIMGGPNVGKAAGRDYGNEKIGQTTGRAAATAAGLIGAYYGGPALMSYLGAGSTGSGMGYGAGSGLSAKAGGLGSYTGYGGFGGSGLGLTSGGGLGLNAGAGAASTLGAGSANPGFLSSLGSSLSSGLSSLGSGLGSIFTSGPGGAGGGGFSMPSWGGLGLGALDLGLRYKQSEDLKDIANEAAQKADALSQPQRLPYQQLLSDYLLGNAKLTDQPYVKANLDFAMDQANAMMAKQGRTGSGGAPRELLDYANQAYSASALPYIQQLSGMGGFGFAPGNAGGLYGNLMSQATGAPFLGLYDFARMANIGNTNVQPWQRNAYNSQQQMFGSGPGPNWTIS